MDPNGRLAGGIGCSAAVFSGMNQNVVLSGSDRLRCVLFHGPVLDGCPDRMSTLQEIRG
jgi:hypothetical protein